MFKFQNLCAAGAGLLLAIGSITVATASPLGTPSTSPTTTSFVFPSTNADNFAAGTSWVQLVSSAPGSIELLFTNNNSFSAYFEYRVDNAPATSATPHYLLSTFTGDDSLYPFYSVAANSTRTESFSVASVVDIRHAFGPEQDVHFDWTSFEASAVPVPGTLLLVGIGFAGLIGAGRRK